METAALPSALTVVTPGKLCGPGAHRCESSLATSGSFSVSPTASLPFGALPWLVCSCMPSLRAAKQYVHGRSWLGNVQATTEPLLFSMLFKHPLLLMLKLPGHSYALTYMHPPV